MVYVNVMKIGLFGFKTLRQTASYTACYFTKINTKQTVSFLFKKTANDERRGEFMKNISIYFSSIKNYENNFYLEKD